MNGDFLDTNVLVYAFSNDRRSGRAQALLEGGNSVGVQSLNEFTNVARGKLKETWAWTHEALDRICSLCETIVPLDMTVHSRGVAISERYKLHIYDALIVAAALKRGCAILWSEDMQDGLIVDGLLTVRNPFAERRAH